MKSSKKYFKLKNIVYEIEYSSENNKVLFIPFLNCEKIGDILIIEIASNWFGDYYLINGIDPTNEENCDIKINDGEIRFPSTCGGYDHTSIVFNHFFRDMTKIIEREDKLKLIL